MLKYVIILAIFVAGAISYWLDNRSAKLPGQKNEIKAEFVSGVYITFATRSYESQVNEFVSGLPDNFKLRVISDNFGEAYKGIKFILATPSGESDQNIFPSDQKEDVILATNQGTLRVRVLNWDNLNVQNGTASGVKLQFDFMLPK